VNYEAFVQKTLTELNELPVTEDALSVVFKHPKLQRSGFWLEFGVWKMTSFRRLAEERGEAELWGFDSFRGLPDDWREGHLKGHFAMDHIPLPPEGTNLVVGEFKDTLQESRAGTGNVTLMHIDCDTYQSTRTVFDYVDLNDFTHDGIIVFDEIIGYPGFEHGEMKAFYEETETWGDNFKYEWIARGKDGQAALIVL
jgi:hypothetical protein